MEQDSSPSVCKMGCGFFGNHSLEGMCSKCHKANVQRKQLCPNTNNNNTSENNNNNNNNNNQCQSPGSSSSTPQQQHEQSKPSPLTKTETNQTDQTDTKNIIGHQKTKEPECTTTPVKNCILPTPSTPTPSLGGPVTPPTSAAEKPDAPSQSSSSSKTKRNRCASCRKRVGLTGCVCRCGEMFCGIHRYSDKHECTFDYKTDGRKRLAQENPVVVGEKIKKL